MKIFLPLSVLIAFAANASARPLLDDLGLTLVDVGVPVTVANRGGLANDAGIGNGAVVANGAGVINRHIGANGGVVANSDGAPNSGLANNGA